MANPGSPEGFLQNVFSKAWQIFIKDAVLYILAFVLLAVLSMITLGILAGPLTGVAGERGPLSQ
jgi:hypothetical protein